MNRNELFARRVLQWVSAGHFLTGVLAFVSGEWAVRVGCFLYGASFEPSDQFLYIIRPLGAFMIGFAALQWQASQDPRRHTAIIDATLGVMFLRQFQRIIYAPDIFAAFGIPPERHWLTTGAFLATTLTLLWARALLDSPAEAPPKPPVPESTDADESSPATAEPAAEAPPAAPEIIVDRVPESGPSSPLEEEGAIDEEPAQEAVFEAEETSTAGTVTPEAPADPAPTDDAEEAV